MMFRLTARTMRIQRPLVHAPLPASTSLLHTTARLHKGPPTHSEEAVHAEKHDASPEELQKQTANKAQQEASQQGHQPTASEEAAKADVADHDPLPDHKKKKNSSQ